MTPGPSASPRPIQINDLMRLAERLLLVEHALNTMALALGDVPTNIGALEEVLPAAADAYLYGLAGVAGDVARDLRDLDGEYVRPR